jgi:hypothetical protein
MEAATLYSKGMILCEENENHKKNFIDMADKIKEAFTW